ncbi:MAG: hypothetical protein P8X53_08400 [Chromatiales bacterium]
MKESTKEVLSHPVSQAEPFVENLFFNYRAFWLLFFLLLTVFFGYHASKIQPDASFEKMIPTSHPYIENLQVSIAATCSRCGRRTYAGAR